MPKQIDMRLLEWNMDEELINDLYFKERENERNEALIWIN